jgi:ATP-dependent Zn protease
MLLGDRHAWEYAEQAEQRIRVWLEEGQQKTEELLLQHKTLLQEIAGQLLEKESLYADEIDFLFK